MHLDESVLKAETPMLPQVHPLAILGVVPLPIVLPGANGFPTSETRRSFSHVSYMSLALVPIAEGGSAQAAIPFPSHMVERGGGLAALCFGR